MRERLRRTRVRLTMINVAIFAMVAGAAAVAFWSAYVHFQYDVIDASLQAQADRVVTSIEDQNGRVSIDRGESLPGETSKGIAIAAVLIGQDGSVLDRSGWVSTTAAYAALAERHPKRPGLLSAVIGGRPERVLLRPIDTGDGRSAVLVLARPIDELKVSLAEVALLLVGGFGGMVVGAGVLGYWLAGRALHPVRMMAAAAHAISDRDLRRRMSVDLPPGDELCELATTFNAMLDRLERAFESLQRFTADAAHELRAPLALMRTQVEVALRRQRTAAEYVAGYRSLMGEIERLSRLADQLLLLARADAGALAPERAPLDLPDLVEEVVERWRPTAQERGVTLQSKTFGTGTVAADEELLRRVLDNLIDNGLRHTPRDGSVTVEARYARREWQIIVHDTGSGVAAELRPRLFERFARADAARARATGGAGLGLSLCAAIVNAHGGSITLDETAAGARFVLRLPTVLQA